MTTRQQKVGMIYAEGMKNAMCSPAFEELRDEMDMSNEYITHLAYLFFSYGVGTAMRCHKELNALLDTGDASYLGITGDNINALEETVGVSLDDNDNKE